MDVAGGTSRAKKIGILPNPESNTLVSRGELIELVTSSRGHR